MDVQNITFTNCQNCHSTNKVSINKISNAEVVCGKCGKPITFHQLVTEIDDDGLHKLIVQSTLPLVVDFWAPWCGPCKIFSPTFETVSLELKGRIAFVKVNTEKFPTVSEKLKIRGIPTLIVFKNGNEVQRISGALPADQFKKWLSSHI